MFNQLNPNFVQQHTHIRPFRKKTNETAKLLTKTYKELYFSLHMHAKPSFAHRLQTAKMASGVK